MLPPTVSDGAGPQERSGKACAPTVIAAKVKPIGSGGQGISLETKVESFFDAKSNTITYLVWDEASSRAAIIDPGARLRPCDRHGLHPLDRRHPRPRGGS